MNNISVIINNRNLLTWPRAMVERIMKYEGVGRIIILDNDSTYPPLLEYYSTKPCEIIYLHENLGHTAPWLSGVANNQKEEYVVTDPDLDLSDTPDDSLLFLKEKMNEHNIQKIGFGLDWQSVNKNSRYYHHLQTYEKSRWEKAKEINNVFFGIDIDTTFALYHRELKQHILGGVSTGHPYIARHMPWYFSVEERIANDEFTYYLNHANSSCSYKGFI